MIIGYLSKPNIAPIITDTARMIRAHRDDARHRRVIAAYRHAHPLCQKCITEAHTTATEQIHHITPVHERGLTVDANLLALCLPCHAGIDAMPREEQRAIKQTQDIHR